MLIIVVQDQLHRACTHFGRKLVRGLAHDAPPCSEVEPPANSARFKVAELHVRTAVLKGFTAFGIPTTKAVREVRPGTEHSVYHRLCAKASQCNPLL